MSVFNKITEENPVMLPSEIQACIADLCSISANMVHTFSTQSNKLGENLNFSMPGKSHKWMKKKLTLIIFKDVHKEILYI